jgi:hypothetical protein
MGKKCKKTCLIAILKLRASNLILFFNIFLILCKFKVVWFRSLPALGSSNLSIITFRFSSLTFFSFPLTSLALDSGAGEPDLELKKILEQCFAFELYSFIFVD